MTKETFVADLVVQFRDKDNDDRNTVFYNNVTTFSNKCLETKLRDVYEYIVRAHTYPTPFPVAKLYKYAESKKYMIEENKEDRKTTLWWKCEDCKTLYSFDGKGCPKCKSHKVELCTSEAMPENTIIVHEDCHYCTIYPETRKRSNERKQYAVGCNMYGIKQDPKCNICQCKECCTQMMMYRADPKGTIEKYRTTELAQPWLVEVPGISETANEMLEHMVRSR